MAALVPRVFTAVSVGLCLALLPAAAVGQIAVSANDGKVRMMNGAVEVVKNGVDTISLVDLRARPPKLIAEIKAAASVVGPPQSVAINPHDGLVLVTAATRIDPANPTKTTSGDTLTIIDLGIKEPGFIQRGLARIRGRSLPAPEPKVLGTMTLGKGPAGVTINRAGTLALVANRDDGTVSVLTIADKIVKLSSTLDLGDPKSGPSAIVITPDGTSALVTLDGEATNAIAVLAIDGTKVTDTKRRIYAGLRPSAIDIAPRGDFAMVANAGRGSGDTDTISVIDLVLKPPRVVNTVSVGPTPSGIKLSPDGRFLAVTYMSGSTRAGGSPQAGLRDRLVVFRRTGMQLTKAVESDVGRWCQGIAWSSDGRQIVVQCMVEQQLFTFTFTGRQLYALAPVKVSGGPAGIRTVEK